MKTTFFQRLWFSVKYNWKHLPPFWSIQYELASNFVESLILAFISLVLFWVNPFIWVIRMIWRIVFRAIYAAHWKAKDLDAFMHEK